MDIKTKRKKYKKANLEESSDDLVRGEPRSSRQSSFDGVSSGSYVFTFILVVATLLIYDITFLTQETIDIQSIKSDLLDNVHNQNESVYLILDSLNQMLHHGQHTQIINFIGSTGVGKTFVANILKKHFYSVFDLNAVSFNNLKEDVVNNLKYSNHDYNLVVVEDLTEFYVDKLLIFLKKIPQDSGTFVICIFNIQETDSELNHRINYNHIDQIVKKFNDAEISYRVAKFHTFDKNKARDWVAQQLVNKKVRNDDHSQIVEKVLSNQDITYYGLKGLSSKINLEL